MQALRAPLCVAASGFLVIGVLIAGCRAPAGAGSASGASAAPSVAQSASPTATAAASLAGRYAFTDLGVVPPGLDSMAFGVARLGAGENAQTIVVGHADTGPNSKYTGFHAFMWVEAAGRMFDLGTMRGDDKSNANGVNAMGQIVGESLGAETTRAFLYDGRMHNLGGLGGPYSGAHAISDSGQVVGYAKTPDGADHAVLWTTSAKGRYRIVDLGMLPGGIASIANGINASGQVIGYSNDADSFGHAFLWSPTSPGASSGTMTALGGLPGEELASAYAINASGVVVGEAAIGPDAHAFAWTPTEPNDSDGTMVDLGTLGGAWSRANAINAAGDIVGVAEGPAPESFDFAFLYRNGTMYDLNSVLPSDVEGVFLTTAYGITDTGQIIGGATVDQHSHAFLLTPVE